MLTGLLTRRKDGMAFDDERFAEAYMVSVRRVRMPPTQYFAYGLHAMEQLKDPSLAQFLFRMSAEQGADDPEFVASLVQLLVDKNESAQAAQLTQFARDTLGIQVDIPTPPTEQAPQVPPQ